jgi:hypothetical protein
MRVEASQYGAGHQATVTKLKDAEDRVTLNFDLKPITLERDDGKKTTTCVVAESVDPFKRLSELNSNEAFILSQFDILYSDGSVPVPGGVSGARGVGADVFRSHVQGKLLDGPNGKLVQNAINGLILKRRLAIDGGVVWRLK